MKSIFTNLGKLLLCGVVVAMVGCTDFKEDIRVVDEKVNSLTESTTADKATLTQTLDALKKDVTDNYYTKQQIDAVQDALEKSISDEVKGIEDQIKGLNDAITAATNAATAAIADLDGKKADKATVEAAQKKAEDAIAALQEALEGVKTTHSADIKKLEDQIAAAKKDLEGKVGANTTAITALEGQVKTLGAQILELQNMAMSMGIQLQEDMNEIAADLGEEIDAVDAKALELKNDLVALTDHLNEYEQTTDLKLTELHGSLQALSVYLEEYKKEIDLKLTELHGSLQALSVYLEENMVTGEDFAFKMAEVDGAITALNNLLSDLGEKHDKDINEVYAEISKRFDETNGALTTVLELIEGLEAEDQTIYNELNLTKEMLTTVYKDQLALSGEVSTIKATLDARKEAAEAFKAEYDKKIAELEAEDKTNTDLIHSIGTALDSYVEDINAELELVNAEFTKVREEMTQMLNLLTDAHQADMDELWKELNDRKEVTDGAITALNNLVGELQKEDENIYVEINYVKEFATKNLADINTLKATVETLKATVVYIEDFKNWEAGHVEEHNNLLTMINNINTFIGEELEEIKADAAYDRDQCQKTATALNNLIEDVAGDLEKLRGEFDEKFKGLDKVIESLEDRLNKRIGALEEEVGKIKVDVEAIKTNLKELGEALDKAEKEFAAADKKFASDIAGLRQLCKDQEDNIGKNQTDIYNNAQDIAKIYVELDKINLELADNAEWQGSVTKTLQQLQTQLLELIGFASEEIEKLQGQIDGIKVDVEAIKTNFKELGETLDKAKKEFAAADEKFASDIAGLRQLCKDQEDNIGLNQTNIYNNAQDIAKIYVKLHEINLELADNAEWQGSVTKTLQQLEAQLLELIGFAFEEIEKLQGQIDDLVNRVQSLVYVPKYSDNLAYMEYARVIVSFDNREDEIFFEGNTELTYKVNAKDASAVAEALAKCWMNNPETFDYDVTDVKTRGASKTGADLEIVKVAAEDQYITVTVKPIAFDEKDFWAASHDDDDGIYSASLVISDSEKNNFRATEYLNLVPEAKARADKFVPVLYREGGEKPYRYYGTEDYFGPEKNTIPASLAPEFKTDYDYYIPANDTEMRKQLIRAYFGFEDRKGNILTPEKVAELYNIGDVTFFNKFDNGQFIGAAVGGTVVCEDSQIAFTKTAEDLWEAHVTEDCVWDLVGESCDFQYCYIWNGLQFTLTHIVEVSNAIINIYVGDKTDETTGEVYTELPWTVALAESLYDGANFAKDLVIEDVPYAGVPDLKLALEGKATSKVVEVKDGEDWKAIDEKAIIVSAFNNDTTIDLKFAKSTYSWNNEYRVVWTSVDNTQHINATITAIVKLTGKPEKIDVNIKDFDYGLVMGTDYFEGAIDLEAASYAAIESYLGYADANAAKWTAEFATLRAAYNNGDFGTPEVNEAAGKSENLADLDKAARLYPADDAINYGAANTTTLTVEPWFDVPVNFTVTGTANKPSNALIYSEDHVEVVVDPVTEKVYGKVQVYGQVGEDGKYSIILSDLAKYFNVDGDLNHNMKVKFEVTKPEIEAQVMLIDKDGNASAKETPVLAKTVGTYNYLVDGNVILDWHEYNATEVPVRATLIAEDLVELGSLDLVLWTMDPLDLLAKEGTADSEGRVIVNVDRYPRTATIVPVYKNLVIRGLLEGPEVNLLDPEAASLANVFDKSNAPHTYGAKLDIKMFMQSVYYYKDDATTNPTYIDINKYTYDPVSGILVLKGDDGSLRRPIYADFNLTLSHRICDGKDKLVAVRVIFNHVPNIEEQETITAGTYGFDPTELLADGYVAVKNGEVWHVVPEDDVVPDGFDAVAKDGNELVDALENAKDVFLIDDVTIDPAGMSNAYGTTGLNVKNGQTIDGNGNILDIHGAGGTWDSGICTTGGLIQNITVKGAFRGIFINHNSSHSETVILKNVILEDVTYTISCDQGKNQNLEAYNSTFKGWTSYAATIGKVSFTDCYFGEGNGYAYCRPYAPTSFVRCEFEAGFKVDARAAVTFEDCTLNGVALTAENLATLMTSSSIANATIK